MWDMTHDGAETIPGAKVDSGDPGLRVPVAPGTYTVTIAASGQTLKSTVEVKSDPRLAAARRASPGDIFAPARLQEQEALALRVRDDISKLSESVARIRAIKKQLDLRKELLKDRTDAKELLKQSAALAKKLDDLEGKLHNPKAKISYDVFSARGGAMLYSQLAWLLVNLTGADGAPTKPQRDLADDLEKQLGSLLKSFDTLAADDLAKLNAAAKTLGVPELYVPPVKVKDEAPPAKK